MFGLTPSVPFFYVQFEELLIAGANSTSVLDVGFDSEDLTLALELTGAASDSKFFKAMPDNLKKIVTTEKVTYNNHECGITPEHFANNAKLTAFYNVLSTNKDKKGVAFVSTMEAKNYPIFGTQWHPEKIMLFVFSYHSIIVIVTVMVTFLLLFSEWKTGTEIDHGFDSVELNSWTARFFVNECRQSLYFQNKAYIATQTD